MSSVLLGGAPSAGRDASSPVAPVLPAPLGVRSDGETERGGAVTVIAGVGVLLLAMGVGVLIGRSSASPQSGAGPAQVISVSAPGSQSGTSTTSTTRESTTPEASAQNKASAKRGSSSNNNGAARGAIGAGGGGGGGSTAGGGHGKRTSAGSKSGSSGGGNSGKSYEERSKNLPNVVSTG